MSPPGLHTCTCTFRGCEKYDSYIAIQCTLITELLQSDVIVLTQYIPLRLKHKKSVCVDFSFMNEKRRFSILFVNKPSYQPKVAAVRKASNKSNLLGFSLTYHDVVSLFDVDGKDGYLDVYLNLCHRKYPAASSCHQNTDVSCSACLAASILPDQFLRAELQESFNLKDRKSLLVTKKRRSASRHSTEHAQRHKGILATWKTGQIVMSTIDYVSSNSDFSENVAVTSSANESRNMQASQLTLFSLSSFYLICSCVSCFGKLSHLTSERQSKIVSKPAVRSGLLPQQSLSIRESLKSSPLSNVSLSRKVEMSNISCRVMLSLQQTGPVWKTAKFHQIDAVNFCLRCACTDSLRHDLTDVYLSHKLFMHPDAPKDNFLLIHASTSRSDAEVRSDSERGHKDDLTKSRSLSKQIAEDLLRVFDYSISESAFRSEIKSSEGTTTGVPNLQATTEHGSKFAKIPFISLHTAAHHEHCCSRDAVEVSVGKRCTSPRGCILADEMGLGKTLSCLLFLHHTIPSIFSKAIILSPLSVQDNWMHQLTCWFGSSTSLRILRYHASSETDSDFSSFFIGSKFNILLITYDTARSKLSKLAITNCDVLVCDEAHRLKNMGTRTRHVIQTIPCRFRLAITGTPMPNHSREIISLMSFITEYTLVENLERLSEDHIRMLLKSLMLRRTMKSVSKAEEMLAKNNIIEAPLLSDGCENSHNASRRGGTSVPNGSTKDSPTSSSGLPCCTIHFVSCRNPVQSKISHISKEKLEDNSGDFEISSWVTTLAMDAGSYDNEPSCVDPLPKIPAAKLNAKDRNTSRLSPIEVSAQQSLFDKDSLNIKSVHSCRHDCSTKLNFLSCFLTCWINADEFAEEQLIIASYSTTVLDYVASFCTSNGYLFYRLDGQSSPTVRQTVQRHFGPFSKPQKNSSLHRSEQNSSKSSFMQTEQRNCVRILLLSCLAGSEGINLQRANRLVLMDAYWNSAAEKQCISRVWRTGQKRNVYVYRLFLNNSVEENLLKMQNDKDQLWNNLVRNSSLNVQNPNFSMADIESSDALLVSIVQASFPSKLENSGMQAYSTFQNKSINLTISIFASQITSYKTFESL